MELYIFGRQRRVFTMILTEVELYDSLNRAWILFESIIDTGATYCGIAEHVAHKF